MGKVLFGATSAQLDSCIAVGIANGKYIRTYVTEKIRGIALCACFTYFIQIAYNFKYIFNSLIKYIFTLYFNTPLCVTRNSICPEKKIQVV